MPSSATITAFYNFTANTKARATQVNNNFDVLRGHIIPIDPNTSTAATTVTYDLGSTEYRWRTGYFREVDFKSNTSTGQALQIVGDTATGQGAFLIKHAGNTRARIGGGNQYVDLDTTTSQFDFKANGTTLTSFNSNKWSSNIPTSTGQWDYLLNGSTFSSVKLGGFERGIIKPTTFWTTSIPTTGTWSISTAGSSNAFLVGTLSVTSNGHSFKLGMNFNTLQTTGSIYILFNNTTTGVGGVLFDFYKDGTDLSNRIARVQTFCSAKDTTTSNGMRIHPKDWCIDSSCSSGGHTYYCYVVSSGGNLFFQQGCQFQAIELV